MQYVIHDVENLDGVGAGAPRLVIENVAHHAQHVATAFLGRQIALDAVGVQQQPHLVAVAYGGECQQAREFRSQVALGECD